MRTWQVLRTIADDQTTKGYYNNMQAQGVIGNLAFVGFPGPSTPPQPKAQDQK